MAILDFSEKSLKQGAVLDASDISLYGTGPDDRPVHLKCDYVLVLSRDCHIEHQDYLMVAPVKEQILPLRKTPDTKDISFKLMKQLLDSLRDGILYDKVALSDLFYLGNIHGTRYAAELQNICLIRRTFKTEKEKSLADLIVATLESDFRAHLHSRLFGTFSKKGFDDHAWFSDSDLAILVNCSKSELLDLEKKVLRTKNEIEACDGKNPQKVENLKQKMTDAEQELTQLKTKRAPYSLELERRKKLKGINVHEVDLQSD